MNWSLPNFQLKSLIDQHDAVAHVLQHRAHVLARRLDLGARRGELLLLQLVVGDVDRGADHAVGVAVGPAQRDAALARPAPLPVIVEIAVFGGEARHLALEMRDQRLQVMREIVRVQPLGRLLGREELPLFHAEDRAQPVRVVDRVLVDFPVEVAVIDRLEREAVALLLERARRGIGRWNRRLACPIRRGFSLFRPFWAGFLA